VVSGGIDSTSHHGSLFGEIAHAWQLYLPRLPGMPNDFPGFSTTLGIWFDGYVGLYGWFDTTFPGWVSDAGPRAGGAAAEYGQARYLLPLLGAVLALAARGGAGARPWER
jgi:hypothetical protein